MANFAMNLLTTGDVCERLKISRSTLYRLRKAGKIGYVLVRGSIRYRMEDIEAFLNESIFKSKNFNNEKN